MHQPDAGVRPKRRSIRWWQVPLLPVTFPLSLLALALGVVVPRVRGLRLWKTALVFMIVWTVYGQLTVWFDSRSGHGPRTAFFSVHSVKAELDRRPYQKGYVYNNPSWTCDPTDRVRGNWGGWPLGKPFVLVLACDALIGREICTRTGFPDRGHWIVRQYEWTLVDYLVDRRISSSYLFMGLLALVELVVTLPWLVGWGAVQLLRHVHVSWR